MLIKKFWMPAVTSQFMVCTIPFRLDTYRGCMFNCKYCFARDNVMFHRRNTDHYNFTYLECNDSEQLEKWIQKTINKPYNYNNPPEVAFKERIPLKIGVMADPFPYIESKEKVTYDILKVLDKYDYPIQMSTKNPSILAEYYSEFENPNWVIATTIISTDMNFVKAIETNAPSIIKRFEGIRHLTQQGAKVIVRIQPVIYPKILDELPELIKLISESGCFGFVMEGLKVRKAMNKSDQDLYKEMSEYLGYDLRQWYKNNCTSTGSDWELTKQQKSEYISLAQNLANKYNLSFYVGDNGLGCVGCSSECCGTKVLRNYKTLNNTRSEWFNEDYKSSSELEKCKVNFWRGKTYKDMTIKEAIQYYRENVI